MDFGIHDIFGALGVLLIVGIYYLLQIGRIKSSSLTYSFANAAGAALILFSLWFEFNLAAFLVEFFWLLISILGMARWFRLRRAPLEIEN